MEWHYLARAPPLVTSPDPSHTRSQEEPAGAVPWKALLCFTSQTASADAASCSTSQLLTGHLAAP